MCGVATHIAIRVDMSDWLTVAITLAHIAILTTALVSRFRRPGANPLAPLVALLAAQFITFGLRPLLLCYDQEHFGFYYPLVLFDEDGFRFAAISGLSASVFILCGFAFAPRLRLNNYEIYDVVPRRATLLLVICGLALGLLALSARMQRARIDLDSVDSLVGRLRGNIGKETVGYGYETAAWMLFPVYICALAGQFLGHVPRRPILVLAVLVLSLVLVLPIGAREPIIMASACVASIWHYRYRHLPVKAVTMFAGIIFAATASVLYFRQSEDISVLDIAVHNTTTFDGFECLVAMWKRFDARDVLWGRGYFESIVYTYFPRIWWPSKPTLFGMLAGEAYVFPEIYRMNGGVGTYPIGFVAEALHNFWYFGLVVTPFAIGFLFGILEGLAESKVQSAIFVCMNAAATGHVIDWARGAGDTILAMSLSCVVIFLLIGVQFRWRVGARPAIARRPVALRSNPR